MTLTGIDEQKPPGGIQPKRSLGERRRSMGARLETATRLKTNFIIRPRSTTAAIIQLDDPDAEKAGKMAPHAFMASRGHFREILYAKRL